MTEIKLPAGQNEGSTNEMGQWLKRVGDPVRKDEPLLEIITDKVTVEIASPADGVLTEILKQQGEPITADDVLGRIDGSADGSANVTADVSASGRLDVSASRPQDHQPPSRRAAETPELSPAVRRLIQQHGLNAAAGFIQDQLTELQGMDLDINGEAKPMDTNTDAKVDVLLNGEWNGTVSYLGTPATLQDSTFRGDRQNLP